MSKAPWGETNGCRHVARAAEGTGRVFVSSLLVAALAATAGFVWHAPDSDAAAPGLTESALTFEDPDHDGLPSALEYVLRTDPYRADSDEDGFDDAMETVLGSDPLYPDAEIDEQTTVRVEFFPVNENRLGLLFLTFGVHGFDVVERFRVLAGRDSRLESRTSAVLDHGYTLDTPNDRIASIAIAVPLESLRNRLNVVVDMVELGRLHSTTRAFGRHGGEYFVQNFVEAGDGFLDGTYSFLGERPFLFVPGVGGNWGGQMGGHGESEGEFLEDRVFTERIFRIRRKGLIIDTVIENRCDENPEERCPTDLDTVGEIRTGPAR